MGFALHRSAECHRGAGGERGGQRPRVLGIQGYGVNLLAKLTPTRGVEYYAGYDFQNYSGEDAVLLIAPNTERVNAVFGQIQTTHDLIRNVTLTAGARYNARLNKGMSWPAATVHCPAFPRIG